MMVASNGGAMRDTILILSNSEDGAHTDSVISELERWGGKYFRFDSDLFSTGDVDIVFKGGREIGFTISSPRGSIKSENIGCVWYRRPNHLTLRISDPVQKHYAEHEFKSLMEGLWRFLGEDVFWVNNPTSLEDARHKILHFRLAKEFGLPMPQTIITNNPQQASDFVSKNLGNSVFKAISHELLDYEGAGRNIPTTLMREEHLSKLGLVRNLPALFQEVVRRQYEVRATFVGDEVFAAKIVPKDPSCNIDWRHPHLHGNVDYSAYRLPDNLLLKCRGIMSALDLRYCVFDFARDAEGEYIFFEINANGQWYWLEKEAGLPISRSIAQLLISGLKKVQA